MRLEPWERLERASRPLPSVAHQLVDSEGARGLRESPHRSGLPSAEIEIAVALGGRLVAPRVLALFTPRRTIGRAMKLGFRGKGALRPARKRLGLGLAHVDRRAQEERLLREHPAMAPSAVA